MTDFPKTFPGEETTVLTCFVVVLAVGVVVVVVMSWAMQSSRGGLVYAAGLDRYNIYIYRYLLCLGALIIDNINLHLFRPQFSTIDPP